MMKSCGESLKVADREKASTNKEVANESRTLLFDVQYNIATVSQIGVPRTESVSNTLDVGETEREAERVLWPS